MSISAATRTGEIFSLPSFLILISTQFSTLYYNRGISVAVQTARIKNQLEHIDAMLDAASQEEPTWLLVAGHYPIFSVGEHGDTSELKDYLLPLLQKYNVDAYFCGHDHLSEVQYKYIINMYCKLDCRMPILLQLNMMIFFSYSIYHTPEHITL